jgi:hypothetical protein
VTLCCNSWSPAVSLWRVALLRGRGLRPLAPRPPFCWLSNAWRRAAFNWRAATGSGRTRRPRSGRRKVPAGQKGKDSTRLGPGHAEGPRAVRTAFTSAQDTRKGLGLFGLRSPRPRTHGRASGCSDCVHLGPGHAEGPRAVRTAFTSAQDTRKGLGLFGLRSPRPRTRGRASGCSDCVHLGPGHTEGPRAIRTRTRGQSRVIHLWTIPRSPQTAHQRRSLSRLVAAAGTPREAC